MKFKLLLIFTLILSLFAACSNEDVPGIVPVIDKPNNIFTPHSIIINNLDSLFHTEFNEPTKVTIKEVWYGSKYNVSYPSSLPEQIIVPDSMVLTYKYVWSQELNKPDSVLKRIAYPIVKLELVSQYYSTDGFTHGNPYYEPFHNIPSNKLKKFVYNSIIETVSYYCFRNSPELETVVLNDKIKSIENSAFENCHRLRSIKLPESLEYLGGMSFYGSGLCSITLPAGIREIGKGSFGWCNELLEIRSEMAFMPNGVVYNCEKLQEVEFVADELTLSCYFENCPSLEKIISHSKSPIKITRETLTALPEDVKFHVSKSLKSRYETDIVWKDFLNCLVFEDF